MIKLRPYQEKLIIDARKSINSGKKRVCCVLGCGGGKSIVQGTIAKNVTDKQGSVLFLVHRKELCEQIRNTFELCGVDFNYCNVQMVQTVTRRIDKLNEPKLIIVDECHHLLSNSYMRIIEAFPKAILTGFTATPVRMCEGGLGKVFEQLIESVSTKWLIENHYLSPYKYYGVTLADTSKLHTKNGDYDKHEVEALMNQGYIFGNVVENWQKLSKDKKTIIYCSSINTSKATVQAFNDAGINAKHLDGTTPKAEREKAVSDFRKGVIKVLSNVDLFGEGLDIPSVETVCLCRPTKSLSLH